MRMIRLEPDIAAVAVLALAMLAPSVWAGRSGRGVEPVKLRPAAYGEFEWGGNPDAIAGFDGILDWTFAMEKRGERVWDRLNQRMRRFEERFEKFSTKQHRLRAIAAETDSE